MVFFGDGSGLFRLLVSWDRCSMHGLVARSTFRGQKAQNTSVSEHFWKLRCWKSVRRCGAKLISKSKGAKHTTFGALLDLKNVHGVVARSTFQSEPVQKKHHMFGPLLEVEISKRCRALRSEAHVEIKWLFTTRQQQLQLQQLQLHYTIYTKTTTTLATTLCYITLEYTNHTTLQQLQLQLQPRLHLRLQQHYPTLTDAVEGIPAK
jgi:hypothetical protein